MGHREHKEHALKRVDCAVITVSDSRTREDDESGAVIRGMLERHAHRVVSYDVLPDDEDLIRTSVANLRDAGTVRVLIVNGGTGLSSRDRTPEAVSPLMTRVLPGFGELFRYLSFRDIGSAGILSRASAGVVGSMVTFLLPGSPEAARLAMTELILPEMAHLVFEVDR
jgi:molybdenum cofactor biosynthesis protein B